MGIKTRKSMLAALLALVLLLLCSCKQNPTQEKLYARLTAHFASHGYTCSFAHVDADRAVPIYKAEAWQVLLLNGEEVLLYFDESNRADYLADGIDASAYSFVGHLGLRFVLVYEGQDEGVLEALRDMPQV